MMRKIRGLQPRPARSKDLDAHIADQVRGVELRDRGLVALGVDAFEPGQDASVQVPARVGREGGGEEGGVVGVHAEEEAGERVGYGFAGGERGGGGWGHFLDRMEARAGLGDGASEGGSREERDLELGDDSIVLLGEGKGKLELREAFFLVSVP